MILEFTASDEKSGVPLSVFLRKEGVSAALIKKLKFLPDGILVNGVKQNSDYSVKTGDKISLDTDNKSIPKEQSSITPQNIPMDIVYQDNCCMAVNKPFDMPVHPSFNHPQNTLANAFCGYWKNLGQDKVFRAVNRLDKNTSGLVLIALDAYSAEFLKTRTEKGYTAIVHGCVSQDEGIIELPIAREKDSIITRCVRADGQYAKTQYRTIKKNNEFSLLDIKLHTGRTHQIRVHFSHLGHPLAGDDMYGGKQDKISRQALHCHKLEFISPCTNKLITVTCSLPADMENIVMKL